MLVWVLLRLACADESLCDKMTGVRWRREFGTWLCCACMCVRTAYCVLYTVNIVCLCKIVQVYCECAWAYVSKATMYQAIQYCLTRNVTLKWQNTKYKRKCLRYLTHKVERITKWINKLSSDRVAVFGFYLFFRPTYSFWYQLHFWYINNNHNHVHVRYTVHTAHTHPHFLLISFQFVSLVYGVWSMRMHHIMWIGNRLTSNIRVI